MIKSDTFLLRWAARREHQAHEGGCEALSSKDSKNSSFPNFIKIFKKIQILRIVIDFDL